MLKIKIQNIENHRVETTFRPFLFNHVRSLFREIGISFVFDGNDWDMCWAAHPNFLNKFKNYEDSVNQGIERINSYCRKGDVFMFDGSDSPSLMGSWDVFKNSNAKAMFKNSLYSDLNMYQCPSAGGRIYWGQSDEDGYNYSTQDDVSEVQLSGTNWLSTLQPQWFDYQYIDKPYDVCALFSYPAKQNWEWTYKHSDLYDKFRKQFLDLLEPLKSRFKIITLENGQHLPIKEYYQIMQHSKIVFAPFGYGEMAPRDVEAVQFGSILMKPDMSHVNTVPNVYNASTYALIDWEGKNMENIIETIVDDFKAQQCNYIEAFRKEYNQRFNPKKLIEFTYNWISKLEGYGTE